MLRIDAHQHFWTFEQEKYGWIGDSMGALRRDYGPADLEPTLRTLGIDGTVLVEARGHLEETDNLLQIAERTPFVLGVVGWLPLGEPDVGEWIAHYRTRPKLRGVRHWLGPDSDSKYMFSDDLHRGIAKLRAAELTYDLMLVAPQLGNAPAFVDRHPDQVFVLDHFAKPGIRARQLEPWASQMRELARRPNVYCKLSGLATEADWARWQPGDLAPYLDVALEAFTPRRLLFGSDWPVCTLASSYARWVETIRSWAERLSHAERDRLFGGTAAEAYRLAL
jgi:L-fuconolactonase